MDARFCVNLGDLLEIDEIVFSGLSGRWNYKGLFSRFTEADATWLDEARIEENKKDFLEQLSEGVELDTIEEDEERRDKAVLAAFWDNKYFVRIKYSGEDYEPGDLDRIAPGTYLEVVKLNPIYMEDGLFGYTYPEGAHAVYIRGDLRGEALRRVIKHEVAHHAMRLGEEAARDLTGTHMHEFLPLYSSSKYS